MILAWASPFKSTQNSFPSHILPYKLLTDQVTQLLPFGFAEQCIRELSHIGQVKCKCASLNIKHTSFTYNYLSCHTCYPEVGYTQAQFIPKC